MDNENKPSRDFTQFRKAIQIPTSTSSYNRYGNSMRNSVPVNGYTLEEINNIIASGDINAMRELSRYYFRTNGVYRNSIILKALTPRYDTVVTPIFNQERIKKKVLLKTYFAACKRVDQLNVPVTFAYISMMALMNGIYYGILRESEDGITVQDLPVAYCRSRFKDVFGLDVLEFNVRYFDTITDVANREAIAKTYPADIYKAYKNRRQLVDGWVTLTADVGGICFSYGDHSPAFIAAIPDIHQLKDAVAREAKRDENELYKLLIQKMPIDRDGELVFPLEEVAEIHASVADMLKNEDTVDVLTAFGDVRLESLQDSTSDSQSATKINKYTKNAYDNLGISALYFNAETSSSLPYSIAKDEAFMLNLTNQYSVWIKRYLNLHFSRTGLDFDFTILPTTIFNYKDVQKQYFQGAQYGYSKIYAGVALGIKQINLQSLVSLENDYLNLTEAMKPLQSSYTTSNSEKKEKNIGNGEQASTLNSEGGREPLPIEQRSEKTEQIMEGK